MLQIGGQGERRVSGPRRPHQAHALAVQQAAMPGPLAVTTDRLIGQHHIQLVQGQALQQLIQAAGLQGDTHLRAAEKGAQQVLLEVA